MSQRWIRAALVVINLVLILVILGTWGYAWRLDRRVDKVLAEPKPPTAEKPAEPMASPPGTPATIDTVTTATADIATTDTVTTFTADTATTDTATTSTADTTTTDTATTSTADTTKTDTATTMTAAPQLVQVAKSAKMNPEARDRRERREGRRQREREGRLGREMARGSMPPGAMPPGAMPGAPNGAPTANSGGLPEELAGLLKSKALFGRQPPPPPVVIQGIMGGQVLINNKWLAVGGSEGPIKLLEIRGEIVVVEVNGIRQENKIWQDMPNPTPPPGQKPPQGTSPPPQEIKPPTPEQVTAMGLQMKQKWTRLREAASRFAKGQGLGPEQTPDQPDTPEPEAAPTTATTETNASLN